MHDPEGVLVDDLLLNRIDDLQLRLLREFAALHVVEVGASHGCLVQFFEGLVFLRLHLIIMHSISFIRW